MTGLQIAALMAYFMKPDNVEFEHNGETRSLAQWIALRADEAVARCMSDETVGAALGKTVVRDSVPANEVKAAIASSTDFPGMPSTTMEKLGWFIDTNPFPMTDDKMTGGVEAILDAFDDAKAKFNALRVRPGTIAESLIGRNLSTNDVSEVLNG